MFSKKDLTNIEGLMMLYAVKTYVSKRHAAKSLNVSLDTMDKYLHILEDELGVKILTASGRGCFLTPQGEKIIKSVDIIKKGIENLYLIKNSETEIKGEVRVAYDLNVKVNYHILVINYLFQ
jgi:DNA-binding transcriptional LysR family regulator